MAHLIECPHCASRFVTIFSPGKVERCPYCARIVVHGASAAQGATIQGAAARGPTAPGSARHAPGTAPGPPDRPAPGHQALGP